MLTTSPSYATACQAPSASISSSLRRFAERPCASVAAISPLSGSSARAQVYVFTFTRPPRISAGSISRSVSASGQWFACAMRSASAISGGSTAG